MARSGASADARGIRQLLKDLRTATHGLVRGQMTWFRDDGMYAWVDVDGREAGEVVDEIMRSLAQEDHQGRCVGLNMKM